MIALISTILGLLSSILPNVVKIYEKKQDLKHEIELTKLRIAAAERNVELTTVAEVAKADVSEGDSLRDHDSLLSGHSTFDALRASIRPVVTYVFFLLFIGIKITVLVIMVNRGVDADKIVNTIWDKETMAIFSAIIGFWFGSRMLKSFMPESSGSKKIDIPQATTKSTKKP